jgi:dTDP-4-amino-4,6-dideoxygalactose transaminase
MKKINTPIPLFKVYMNPNAKLEVGKILDSGYIGQGPKVEEFEHNLRDYFNADKLLTTNSGTSGLHMALHLLKKPRKALTIIGDEFYDQDWPGLQEGDEVLSTALTCTASNFPTLANGLKIKWVDIDPKTLNMDLDDLERKLTPKTKVILAVHWGGYPIDLDRLKKIQEKSKQLYGFKPAIIEDGAHSFGTEYKGKKLGNHGNIVMYSLQAIKHVTAVDGGVLVLPHQELHTRGKLLRWYGIDRDGNRKDFRCEADIPEWGFKFHMNDVNAAVGIENLKDADVIISKHRSNAKYYDDNLKDVKGITLLERNPNHNSAFWIYSMLVENRDGFYKHMKECGIISSQVHERNDKHSCVKNYISSLPNLDKTINNIVSIPVGWWVTEDEREYIVNCIKKGW